jgi:23S rRNA (guanosine2251-2'-O)-methyltransferase
MVWRISAGASEYIPVVRESTMSALKVLRRAGVLVVGADEDATQSFDEVDLCGPVALVMGGEHKGVSAAVRDRCDHLVSLPMRGRIPSLNVSVAAALMIYEKVRQERLRARESKQR